MLKYINYAGHIALMDTNSDFVKEFKSINECGKWVKANVIGGKVKRATEHEILEAAIYQSWHI